MGFGLWNKIKHGFQKVRSKITPIIQKSKKFYNDNKDVIDSGINLVNKIKNKKLPLSISDDDTDDDDIDFIKPKFK